MSTPGVTNDPRFPAPETMKAQVLDDPERLSRVDRPVLWPGNHRGIRGEGRSATRRAGAFLREGRFGAFPIYMPIFAMEDLPVARRCARGRVDGATEAVARNAPAS